MTWLITRVGFINIKSIKFYSTLKYTYINSSLFLIYNWPSCSIIADTNLLLINIIYRQRYRRIINVIVDEINQLTDMTLHKATNYISTFFATILLLNNDKNNNNDALSDELHISR